MSKNKTNPYIRYEVIAQEDPDSDDILVPIPPALLEEMGWKEGDEIEFHIDDMGRIILKAKS